MALVWASVVSEGSERGRVAGNPALREKESCEGVGGLSLARGPIPAWGRVRGYTLRTAKGQWAALDPVSSCPDFALSPDMSAPFPAP